MNIDWILSPLATYAIMAAGLLLCLFLFISLKAETGALRMSGRSEVKDLENTLNGMKLQIEGVETYLRDAQGPSAAPGLTSINFTRRAKALRMHRRGESPASIAAALGAPQNEVDLLIKVSRLMAKS